MQGCRNLVNVGRRQFLKGSGVAAAGAVAASVASSRGAKATPAPARLDYPSNRLANVSDLTLNEPLEIAYPDADSPGVLLKLGQAAEGGVGPEGDIVGFSTMCPHKGYGLLYDPSDRVFNCPGHFSRFDAEKGGLQIWGQATQNLPQFHLRVDDRGDIYAEGVDELIYGRLSNVL
jgi:arsenite oxidase small subunit